MNADWISRFQHSAIGVRLQRAAVAAVSSFKAPLVRQLVHATPLIVLIAVITLGAECMGWLDHFENAGLDSFNILQAYRDPSHVVLVGITDDDYRDYFGAISPLHPDALYRVIGAIAAGRPRLIGVDIDTSALSFGEFQVPADWPAIVWGQDAVLGQDRVVPAGVLGGQRIRPGDMAGIAALPQDSDGVIRRYLRDFAGGEGDRSQLMSFPWAVIQNACKSGLPEFCQGARSASEGSHMDLRLNFSGERYAYSPLSIRRVIEASQSDGWRTDGPLRDKVVLLGGSYRAGRDSYVTPVGTMLGLQLMAQAVESELGGGIRLTNHLIAFLLDIIIGFIIILIHYRFSLPAALMLSLIALPLFSLTCSFLAFSTFAWWINFVPIILGVLIHQLYNHAKEHQRLRQKLAASSAGGI